MTDFRLPFQFPFSVCKQRKLGKLWNLSPGSYHRSLSLI
jgi:hypothetical protein